MQPCLVGRNNPHDDTFSANAHTETGGTSRKADCCTIVPLCHDHHTELHQHGIETFEQKYKLDIVAEAAMIEWRWRAVKAQRTAPHAF